MNELSLYRVKLARTPYVIGLDGIVYHEENGTPLEPYKQNNGILYTKLLYPPNTKRKMFRGKKKTKYSYKTFCNARLLIETLFGTNFKYKIIYKNGDKSDVSYNNLMIRQTIKKGTHYYNTGELIDLMDYFSIIESRINTFPFERILLYIE